MAEYISIGNPVNEAERKGFQLLRDRLPDHFKVLGNFELRLPNRHTSLEYDAVIIGEYGFYAVEIKGWTGLIRGGDRYWVLPWDRRSNPLTFLDKKTKALGQFVRRRVDGLAEDCFFASAMLFPRKEVRFDLPDDLMSFIVGPTNIYEHFVDLELVRSRGPGPFRSEQKSREVIEAITDFAEPAEQGVHLSFYDVEGERQLSGDRPYREYFAQHQYLHSRGKVRIKAYTMDRLADRTERREQQNRILRDMEALEVLDDNPYVARSYDMQPDHDDPKIFYLISEWVGPKTLKDLILRWDDTDVIPRKRMQIAADLVEAVASIHEVGIVHRNLSPHVIYLTRDEASVPFKIADFDFARVSKLESIAEALSHVGTEGYKAPELWLDEDYDHRVDIFALGAMLYEVLNSRVLFRGPGALLQPEQAWMEHRDRIEDDRLRSIIGDMISTDLQRRSSAIERACRFFEVSDHR